jgi:tetratricopeptide (TPR) repeat protein
MMSSDLALFRSCLRKEYRDQVIKMLRGLEGEYTRTAYRLHWVDEAAVAKIVSGQAVSFVGIVVDSSGERAMPVRRLHLRDFDLDRSRDLLRLTLELGSYLDVSRDFSPQLVSWPGSERCVPPDKFVSEWKPTWPVLDAVSYSDSGVAWRRSVDFLTTYWPDFENSVFLRPSPGWCVGAPSAPVAKAEMFETIRVSIDSYNPHLNPAKLKNCRFAISAEGPHSESISTPDIPKDGVASIEFRFLEFGDASIRVEVFPDPMMSSYIPIAFDVTESDEIGYGKPRYLGKDWTKFLQLLADRYSESDQRHEEVLDILLAVFPDDAELCAQRGELHLERGEFRAAADRFARALRQFHLPRAVVGSLLASLHLGDVPSAQYWLERLPLSDSRLFDELLAGVATIPDQVAIDFADSPGHLLSEDKALRLLSGMARRDSSELLVTKLVCSAGELDRGHAVRLGLFHLAQHPDWIDLRESVVGLAARNNEIHLVEGFIGDVLRWRGEDTEEFLAKFHQLGASLQVGAVALLAYENAARMLASTGLKVVTSGFELALSAAENALAGGDLALASKVAVMMFVKLPALDAEAVHLVDHYQSRVRYLNARIGDVSSHLARLLEVKTIAREVLSEVDAGLVGRSVVVLGSGGDDSANTALERRWKSSFKRVGLHFIDEDESPASAANQLRALDPQKTLLYVTHAWLASLSAHENEELRKSEIPLIVGLMGFPQIVTALHDFLSKTGVVGFEPKTCAEAIEVARRDFEHLWLSPEVDETIKLVDNRSESAGWAKAIFRSLSALNDYAAARKRDRGVGPFRKWSSANDGISGQQIKDKESEGTMNTPNLRELRRFSVPVEYMASGSVLMESHIAIGVVMGCPRIHYCVESIDVIGKLCVGYVGQHLKTLGTN